jgi:hypothetical protein
MTYNLSLEYRWYVQPNTQSQIIKVFKINNIPYAFDYLTRIEADNPDVYRQANQKRKITPDDLFRGSYYLSAEEAHPLLFDLKIDKPELLPTD